MDEVQLEHRLTNIENKTTTIDGNVTEVLEQLIKLNGKVYKHEEWITEERSNARELKGFAEGRLSVHKRDLMLLGVALGVLQFAIPYIIPLITSLR